MPEDYSAAIIRLGMDLKNFEGGTARMLEINAAAEAQLKKMGAESIVYEGANLKQKLKLWEMYEANRLQIRKINEDRWDAIYAERQAKITAAQAEESSLRLAASKAQAAGQVEEYKKYQAAKDSITARITSFESEQSRLRIAVAKEEAREKVAIDKAAAEAREAITARLTAYETEMARRRAMANGLPGTLQTSASGVGNFGAGVNVVEEAEGAAQGMKSTIALREAQTIVREIMRGNWTRVLGSFTIFATAFGGVMRKIVDSMFSFTGMMIGAAAFTAYRLYEGIKEYGKNIDAQLKLDSERVVDRVKAHNEALANSVKKAAELEGKLRSLADAHETVADKMEREVRAMDRYLGFQEKFIAASGKLKIAAVDFAEAMGFISQDDAAGRRSNISATTTVSAQQAKLETILKQGQMLYAARQQLINSEPALQG